MDGSAHGLPTVRPTQGQSRDGAPHGTVVLCASEATHNALRAPTDRRPYSGMEDSPEPFQYHGFSIGHSAWPVIGVERIVFI